MPNYPWGEFRPCLEEDKGRGEILPRLNMYTKRYIWPGTRANSTQEQNSPQGQVIRVAYPLEWGVQNESITRNRVLPVTSLLFQKFCFSVRTLCKELIWCATYQNVHIYSFRKRWSFIWQRTFPVSILKNNLQKTITFFKNSVEEKNHD